MNDFDLSNKYLQFGDNVYDVEDFELLENAPAYSLKCRSAIQKGLPYQFKFKRSVFYTISYNMARNPVVISEEDYQNFVKSETMVEWKKVAKFDRECSGDAFPLSFGAISSRDAYIKLFGQHQFDMLKDECYEEIDGH